LVETFVTVVGGGAILLSALSAAILGAVTPDWEGTEKDRLVFWVVFLPSLLLLLAFAFLLGRFTE
jgi:hypothetical protein